MFLALMIIFIVVMLAWMLIKTGSIAGNADWLAFIACLVLGICIFLVGTGIIMIDRPISMR